MRIYSLQNKFNKLIPFLGIIFLCLITYFNCLTNDFLIDDHNFVKLKYNNTFQTASDFFLKNHPDNHHYAPMFYITNMNLFRWFNNDPAPIRAIGLIFFIGNCLLFYQLFLMILKDKATALITTILFIIHPLHNHILHQITLNIIFLNTFFMQCSLLLYLKYLHKNKSQKTYYILSILFFIAALLTHELAIMLPAYLIIILFFFKDFSFKESLKNSGAYMLCVFLFLLLWTHFSWDNMSLFEKISFLNLSFFEYIATITHLFIWYITKCFYPNNVVFIYNSPVIREMIWAWNLLFWGTASGLTFLIACVWKKDIKSFALLWFLLGFVLTFPLSFVQANNGLVIEPYWIYFSNAGFCLLAAIFLVKSKKFVRPALRTILLVIIFSYLFSHTQKNHLIARTEKSFCENWLTVCPTNLIPITTLGAIHAKEKDYPQSISYFQRALKLSNCQSMSAYVNLGKLYVKTYKYDKAERILLDVFNDLKYSYKYLNDLGWVYFKKKDYKKSEYFLKSALAKNPDFNPTKLNLADLYIILEKNSEAINEFEQILTNDPDHPQKRYILINLAVLYSKQGLTEKLDHLLAATLKNKKDMHLYLHYAQALNKNGFKTSALELLKRGKARHPDNKEIARLLETYSE